MTQSGDGDADSGGKQLESPDPDVTSRHASERTLRDAQKMAAIGQLAAGLGHDLNNLLTLIIGNVELARARIGSGTISKALDGIDHAAQQGARLIQQLLTFARKRELAIKRVDLNTLVLGFKDLLATTLGRQIDLRFALMPSLPACMLDPVQLEMAIFNLLINARDAMPKGGRVTVATESLHLDGSTHHVPPGEYVTLSVTDEGEGMPAAIRERAFEPFFTTKGEGKGTGLGLPMVQEFAQQSGGHLEIDSMPGRGTTVRLVFPANAARKEAALSQRGADAARRTVLVLEDSDALRKSAAAHLTELGCSVVTAHSSKHVLDLLDSGATVDLLLTTNAPPGGMGGLLLAERARRCIPRLPVVVATDSMSNLLKDASRAAEVELLCKPYRRSELAERLRGALERGP